LPMNQTAYLNFVDGIYQSDAYHSLSIEGYRVSPELIERVMSGAWDPAHHEADRQSRDALAARGYWQAFQKVKGSVSKVLAGGNAGAIARLDHRDWHRELFEPCRPWLAIATMLSICEIPGMFRHVGKRCAMPCPRYSI